MFTFSRIKENATQLKNILASEIDEMINMLAAKKKELVEFVDLEKSGKVKATKEQITFLSSKVQRTTGLLQFCVETLKEPDASSFLQISEFMINRMMDVQNKFQDSESLPANELDFDFMLNSDALYKEIKKLHYKQIKVPNAPSFMAEGCVNDPSQSVIILSWNQKTSHKNNVQGYILEIDDGSPDGPFKVVF